MTPSNEIFDLIQSMSPTEKRYFKRFSKRHSAGESNVYLTVFLAIAAQASYDEAAIKEKFKGKGFIRQFSATKSYLNKLILKSLRAFHTEKSTTMNLRARLDEIEILFSRGLFAQAQKVLKKGIHLAHQFDQGGYVLEFLQWERKLSKLLHEQQLAERLSNIKAQESFALTQVRKETGHVAIYDDMYFLLRQNIRAREEGFYIKVDELAAASKALSPSLPETFTAQLAHNYTLAFHAHLKGNFSALYIHYRNNVDLWHQFPHQIDANPNRYAKALSAFLGACHTAGNYTEYFSFLSRIRSLKGLSNSTESFLQSHSYSLELLYFLNHHQYEKALAIVPEIEDRLTVLTANSNPSALLAHLYNVSMLYFIVEEYSLCLRWVNRILNHKKTTTRRDIREMAIILNIIVHFELKNEEGLASLVRYANRRLKKEDSLSAYESILLKFTKNLLKTIDIRERRALFSELAELLEKLKTQKGPRLLGIDEIRSWALSKVLHLPVAELFSKE